MLLWQRLWPSTSYGVKMWTVLLIACLCIGASMGSFLTVLLHRLPKGEDITIKSSYCPKCGKKLRVRSLIPLISFIIQGGKCLECKEKISKKYFLIELINTLAYGLLFIFFGLNTSFFYRALLFSLLFLIALTDLENCEIPVILLVFLCIFAIVKVIFNPIDPLYSLLHAATYFIIIEVARFVTEKLTNREVIGGADTALITMSGLILDFKYISKFFIFIGLLGILFGLFWNSRKNDKIFPFGPPIVLVLYILLLCS